MPITILYGLPDNGLADIHALNNGRGLSLIVSGTVGIDAVLPKQRFEATKVYLDGCGTSSVETGPGPLLNHIGDPDSCSKSLALISEIAARIPRPCFNHPAAVARTTRDKVSELLAGIENLDAPKTIRIAPMAPEQLRDVVEAAGMTFPVLVRVAGAHLGLDLVLVESPKSSGEILKLSRNARSLYVTEFRKVSSPDGHYRKWRIVVVGEEIFILHNVVGKEWNVHAASRTPESFEEERQVIESFETKLAPRLRPMFLEIACRLDMDYFGVDCHIGNDGRVTLFEANACMMILQNRHPPPNLWDAPIAKIKEAVFDLLATPQRWRDYSRVSGLLSSPK